MEITSKLLLNSAQSFIKKKEMQSHLSRTSDTKTKKEEMNSSFSTHSRIQKLAQTLKEIQYHYTKEQVRLQYLTQNPDQIHESLKFNNEVLFPELKENMDLKEILNKTQQRIQELKYRLKEIEIEQENYFAVNFISPKELKLENLSTHISRLDPDRVSQLTRNQFLG